MRKRKPALLTPAELLEARRKLGLTQTQLAEALGLRYYPQVSTWERGHARIPDWHANQIRIWLEHPASMPPVPINGAEQTRVPFKPR